jgi:hypothetical protein
MSSLLICEHFQWSSQVVLVSVGGPCVIPIWTCYPKGLRTNPIHTKAIIIGSKLFKVFYYEYLSLLIPYIVSILFTRNGRYGFLEEGAQ